MERRSLLEEEMAPSRESVDVFGDENEVEEEFGVADGFRPSDHDLEGSDEQVEEEQPVRTVSAYYAPTPVSPIMSARPSRNSTRKSMGRGGAVENPFSSPEDDTRMSFEPEFAGHRSISSVSSNNFARTDSPRFGAGPSHPYAMYQQGTMARTPSIATQSTARPSHRTSSSLRDNGPQHPYSLYPQGVEVEMDDEEDTMRQNPVPIGFPGLGQSYRRRLGPDGEEQDIIGEDGHTEQLPPYSRYPEDGPEKVPLLVPEAPTALHSRAPVAGSDPTMALMHDHIQPRPALQPPQSMTDASGLRSGRPRSLASVALLDSGSDSVAWETKSWREKTWKEKRKTRVCGIPFWWILLAVGVSVFVVAVIGGVLGGFFAAAAAKRHHSDGFDTTTSSLYDASALATTVSISPPTGTFQLSLSTPQQSQNSCLTETDQAAAWACDLGGPAAGAISVSIGAEDNELGAFIFYASDDEQISYGTQTSFMETTFAPFITVQDNDDPGSGPAYYFSQFYDKLVVVPEASLSAPTSGKNKRTIQLDQDWFMRRQVAEAGEKPWFCVWNNTFVEGFIYIEQPVVESYYSATSAAETTANSTKVTSSGSAQATSTTPSPSSSLPVIITTTVTLPSTTATFTGAASSLTYWSNYEEVVQPTPTPINGDNGNGQSRRKREEYNVDYDSLSLYPYVIKIEERRLQGNTVQPYCQQYQILNDGGYNWVADSDGKPIIIYLEESDPSYSAYQSAGIAGTKVKRQNSVGGCHCQWLSGQTNSSNNTTTIG